MGNEERHYFKGEIKCREGRKERKGRSKVQG